MDNAAPRDDASVSEEIARLEEELADFDARRKSREEEVRRLRMEEDPGAGKIYAQEIFTAQQDKLRLEVEVQVRRNKINRLRAGARELKEYEDFISGRGN